MPSFTKVYFNAYDGTKLCGNLHSAGSARPTIIMSQGYSGLKDSILSNYAESFHSAGYTVLSYDNRCWGESGGEPRNEVDPPRQTRDYFDAFNYACTLPDVDPTKIVYWGASMAGGNAIVASSINKELKGIIAVVPYVSGEIWPADELSAALLRDRSSTLQGGQSALIPVFPEPADKSKKDKSPVDSIFSEGLVFKAELEKQGAPYEKTSTVQSTLNCMLSEPKAFIHRISPTPLLMVVAGKDITSPTHMQLEAFELAKEPKKLHLIEDLGHYELYFGDGFKRSVALQLDFLQDLFA